MTPLHNAAGEGYIYTVKYLVKNGANKNLTDNKGVSVLDYTTVDLKHSVSNTWM